MSLKEGVSAQATDRTEPVPLATGSPSEETTSTVTGDFTSQLYEPWLFQTMLGELTNRELGVGFIYSILDQFAKRHGLSDVVAALSHESFGNQIFRLGGESISAEMAIRFIGEPGLYCEPDIVPAVECDAVRTACQLALSLHHARFSATHDPLTNISNRRNFDEALAMSAARSARYGWTFTVVIVDLNDFKLVNDHFGHEYGDNMLRHFGFALRQAVRQGDTAARIGGDEFAVILSNAEGHEASGFTERLRGLLAAANVRIEFTTGTATSPRDSSDPTELLRIADGRLYEKKGFRSS
ncbi:MAG: GGDEF domain-containing protein [Acidimicrobiaceae bacterium]|nr:GGDEF domain-containing protein [Acidimicrobiaceae bacterium]